MSKHKVWDTIVHWHNTNGVQLVVLQNAIETPLMEIEATARTDERAKLADELDSCVTWDDVIALISRLKPEDKL